MIDKERTKCAQNDRKKIQKLIGVYQILSRPVMYTHAKKPFEEMTRAFN